RRFGLAAPVVVGAVEAGLPACDGVVVPVCANAEADTTPRSKRIDVCFMDCLLVNQWDRRETTLFIASRIFRQFVVFGRLIASTPSYRAIRVPPMVVLTHHGHAVSHVGALSRAGDPAPADCHGGRPLRLAHSLLAPHRRPHRPR